MLAGPKKLTVHGAVGQRASALVTSHPGTTLGMRTVTGSATELAWSMNKTSGTTGVTTVTPGSTALTSRSTLTLGPALALHRPNDATTPLSVPPLLTSSPPTPSPPP